MQPNTTGNTGDLSGVSFYQYINSSEENKILDAVIIGGSYAGLSAAMALGRSMRRVLVIDSSRPCNSKSVHAHNFITHDGEIPGSITKKARQQVLKYKTINVAYDKVINVIKVKKSFVVETTLGMKYAARKVLFATGLFDQIPGILGFSDCWGISILACPYCNGYEFHGKPMGILTSEYNAFELVKHLSNWTKRLTVFTNGVTNLSPIQISQLKNKSILVNDKKIAGFEHDKGLLKSVSFKDHSFQLIEAIFTKVSFRQSTDIPSKNLGCELTAEGLIKVDYFNRTTVRGIYAAGDNSSRERSIALSVASGVVAGISMVQDLIDEEF